MPRKYLPPIHPNAGAEALYRRKLVKLINDMAEEVEKEILVKYKKNPPRFAQDTIPADELQRLIQRLMRKWKKNFEEVSQKLAEYFTNDAQKRTDRLFMKHLREVGWTVDLKMTPQLRDVLKASINEQVSLIKSIPIQYLSDVEGLVMRSVTRGRDLGYLSEELKKRYGMTRRRAALIARDQNNKATAVITATRQLQFGIKKAIWLHSGGGKEPRPKHVAFSGKEYDVAKGAPIGDKPGEYCHPGELISCRCTSKSIVP